MKLTKTQLKQMIREEYQSADRVARSELRPSGPAHQSAGDGGQISAEEEQLWPKIRKNAADITAELARFIEEGNPSPEDIGDYQKTLWELDNHIETVMVELGNRILPY